MVIDLWGLGLWVVIDLWGLGLGVVIYPVASNILRSSGSPISLPSMMVRLWQHARHWSSRSGACWTGDTAPIEGPDPRDPEGERSGDAAIARRVGETGLASAGVGPTARGRG